MVEQVLTPLKRHDPPRRLRPPTRPAPQPARRRCRHRRAGCTAKPVQICASFCSSGLDGLRDSKVARSVQGQAPLLVFAERLESTSELPWGIAYVMVGSCCSKSRLLLGKLLAVGSRRGRINPFHGHVDSHRRAPQRSSATTPTGAIARVVVPQPDRRKQNEVRRARAPGRSSPKSSQGLRRSPRALPTNRRLLLVAESDSRTGLLLPAESSGLTSRSQTVR